MGVSDNKDTLYVCTKLSKGNKNYPELNYNNCITIKMKKICLTDHLSWFSTCLISAVSIVSCPNCRLKRVLLTAPELNPWDVYRLQWLLGLSG